MAIIHVSDQSATPVEAEAQSTPEQKAQDLAQEYLRRLDAGDEPDLRDYIDREVPAHLRDETFESIDGALASRDDPDSSDDLRPKTEVVLSGLGKLKPDRAARWIRIVGPLLPWSIRRQLVQDVLAARKERRAMGEPWWKVEFASAREILEGIAQRAPLCSAPANGGKEPTEARERTRKLGWIAWRLCGPALLLGYLLGSVGVLALGAALLLTALGALIVVALDGVNEVTPKQARFVNALLGGTVTALTLVVGIGAVCGAVLALSLWSPLEPLAPFAVHLLAFGATAVVCGITASGWSPEEWLPERLVRV